jgi:hypothetical protein
MIRINCSNITPNPILINLKELPEKCPALILALNTAQLLKLDLGTLIKQYINEKANMWMWGCGLPQLHRHDVLLPRTSRVLILLNMFLNSNPKELNVPHRASGKRINNDYLR